MKFKEIGDIRGDETRPYEVTDYKASTVGEFIEEVLKENPNEWGYFRADESKDMGFFDCPRIEYRYGKLLSQFGKAILDKKIVSIKADGGWSNMDYLIRLYE